MADTRFTESAAAVSTALEHDIIASLFKTDAKEDLIRILARIEALADYPAKASLIDYAQKAIALKDRLELLQTRERGLMALIETAQSLTAIRDIDQVLQAIVNRARNLIGCDIGYLSIYDRERGDFYVRATDGAFSEKFKQIRVPRDVGICGFVARNRSAYCSSDYEADSRFAHTNLIDSAVTDEDIKSILGVPLLSGSQVIGVLFVGDRYIRAYNAWEMSILSTLAAHASVAIENARLFEQSQDALRQASEANKQLAQQTADTQIAAEAHERLTTLVARGGGVKELCDMVATMLDGDVVCLDEGEQPAYTALATAHGAPDHHDRNASHDNYSAQDKIHAALVESRTLGKSVTAFATEAGICRVSAVVGGRGMLGGLVIYTRQELNDVAVRIFERSSVVTGVVLLSLERNEAAARSEIPIVLRSLLSQPQHDPEKLAHQLDRHGINPAKPMYLMRIKPTGSDLGYFINRMRKLSPLANTLIDEIDGVLVMIGSAGNSRQTKEAVTKFFTEHTREKIHGVMSEPVEHLSDLPASNEGLCRCLDLLPLLGSAGAIFDESALSLYSILFKDKSRSDVNAFLSSALGKLFTEADARKVELARTLICYLDQGHNAKAAAAILGIHINTFRQRLDMMNAILADWTHSGRALEVHIALRLWQLQDWRRTE
ncbi:GAF domain-containing protein [Janthinobacterium sp. 17J80-10]|uniref:helix-turn-helix domain-containing protein n=1 Tax=Janthinobacterium sp. 17J80-10 TaxID=2497863 RepID=UPI00100565D9|nr:GAF domain-containing protein [Janthinobacterium sp. 17J80-10]QAU33032.1 GAF domain-containing protein [Janthinobacterium sp. 17J80-10]